MKRAALALAFIAAAASALMAGGQGDKQAAQSAKPVTLKFFTYEEVMRPKHDLINAEYHKRHPNVNIEMVYVPSADYETKVDTTILANDQLDICFFNVKFLYVPRAQKGEFLALDKYIAAEGKKYSDLYSIDATYDGKVYALPGDVKNFLIWINKNDLDKAGLPVPPLNWTWDDYRDYAKKLTWGEGKDKHFGSFFYTWDHFNVFEAYNKIDDNPYFKPDGSVNFQDPSFKSSIQLRYNLEMVDKTQMPLADVKALSLDYRNAFFGGRASMIPALTNIIPQTAALQTYPHTFVTTYAAMPMPAGGREGIAYGDNRFYSVGKSTANAEEAYKFLRFFTTEGIPMKNVSFTAAKEGAVSKEAIIDAMVAEHTELFDVPALKRVLLNPKLRVNFWTNVPVYTGEIDRMFQAEAELAVLGSQTPDQAIANAMKQAPSILAKYK
jgi:multiple sugar transport system substrate-binding protein